MSNDPKPQRTEATREALWSGSWIANMDKTGRAAAVQKSPAYSLTSQSIWERSHAWERDEEGKTRCQLRKNRRNNCDNDGNVGRRRPNKVNATQRKTGPNGALRHPHLEFGVHGDCTTDARRTSPIPAVLFFSCEVFVRFQRPRE